MKPMYETHNNISRELLDTIKRGDLVKCNDWKNALRVVATTNHFFLMARGAFGKTIYSVCDKRPLSYRGGDHYRIGRDNLVFGHECGYKWETEEEALEYLSEFEHGEIELSHRGSVELEIINIKRIQKEADTWS